MSDESELAGNLIAALEHLPGAQFLLRGTRIVWASARAGSLCSALVDDGDSLVGRSLDACVREPRAQALREVLASAAPGSLDVHLAGPVTDLPIRLSIGAETDAGLRIVRAEPGPGAALGDLLANVPVDPLAGLVGSAYLERLLYRLVETTGADRAFVGDLDTDGVEPVIRTRGAVHRGERAEDFTYTLAGSPCSDVFRDACCIHPRDVTRLFPDDVGLQRLGIEGYAGVPLRESGGRVIGALILLFESPIRDPGALEQLLTVCAVRAAPELQRMHFEERLAHSERRYRSLVENSDDGLFVQRDERLLYCNPAAARMLGFESPEVLKAHGDMTRFVAPEDRALVRSRARARSLGEPVENHYEVDALRRDGSRIRVQISSSDVEWEGRPALQVLVVDVTRRAQRDELVARAQRMESLGKLTGGIAHDFNNLLAVILGNLELLGESLGSREDLVSLVGQARIAAERGAELTARLLAFARRQSLRPQRVELAALLQETRNLLDRVLGEDVAVRIDDGSEAPVLVDPGQLQTALINLAINARDAMSGGGELVISTRDVPLAALRERFAEPEPVAHVCVEVADDGEGMAPEVLAQAFEPFFTTKSSAQGSGLGLSMVHGFVKQSRGQVEIDSVADPDSRTGTRVRLYLPCLAEAGAAATGGPEQDRTDPGASDRDRAPPAPAVEADAGRDAGHSPQKSPVAGARPLRALVVEDEASVREVAVAMLRGLGFEVLEAADGPGARALVQRERLDLLLSDVVLPQGQRGPDIAMEALERQPSLAVLFMSGYAESSVFQKFRAEHEFSLIRKPFRLGELRRRIEEVLARAGV